MLLILAAAVKATVSNKAKYTDRNQREDIKTELKAGLLLAERDYPLVDRDGEYRGEQAGDKNGVKR